jgi:elongation factor Ts
MAVSIEDIKKLRAMTGAGLADVKKALTEAEGDFDKAKELLRERGLAIAAKRSDRETSNGCVLVKKVNDFAAIIALKCETDFVANGADFIKLTSDILDAAIAAKAHTLDEVKALKVGESDAQAAVTQRSGITGEKMELDGYCVLEGDNIEVYDHMNKHTLCTMVQLNENNEEAGHKVAMQVAAMRPVALDESSVSKETKKTELEVAVAKTKEELVEKAVNAALKKAGINPAHVDSEDHIESNTKKGWLTPEQAEEARNIKKTVGEEKAASLNPTMIQNIANGRLAKFFKENCLVDIAAKAHTLDEVKALKVGESDAQAAVTQRSGITGEKMELDGYCVLEGDNIEVYDHMNKHTLCTMVQLNENNEEAGHKVAMQVAAMRPVALDESSVSKETKKTELEVAVAKTKEELVEKAVNAALKKAGINPAHVDSEDHIESNTKKGWLTPEQAEEARNIKKTVGEEKAASLNPTMIQNIANGRLAKFFKENCLVDQEFQFGDGDKQTVAQYLASQSKDLKVVAYQRFTLAAE